MSENLWEIHDKEWLKSRQERWKSIQQQLKRMLDRSSIFNKEDVRYHKAYFLKGKILPIDEKWGAQAFRFDKNRLGTPFPIEVFFKVWYYPKVDEQLFRQWCEAATVSERYRYCISGLAVDHEHEFFADRSVYLDKYLAPLTYQELFELDKASRPQGGSWISERRALTVQLGKILRGLTAYNKSNAFSHIRKGVSDSFIMCFAFSLLRDMLQSFDDLSVTIDAHNGNPNLGLQDEVLEISLQDKLIKIMTHLVSQKSPPEDYAWGVAARLHCELTDFFDGGVTPQIDELWEQIKLGKSGG